MKRLFVIILTLSLFSCNSKKKEKNVYKSSEKETITYDNIIINNSEAKNDFIQGLKSVESNDYETAYKNFVEADKKEANNVAILNVLANIENSNGERLQAEEKYKRSLQIDSSYIYSYVNYGKLLHQLKRFSEAEKILKIGLTKNPNKTEKTGLYYNLTYTMVMIGNCNKAKEYAILARDNSEMQNQKQVMKYLIEDVEKQCINK